MVAVIVLLNIPSLGIILGDDLIIIAVHVPFSAFDHMVCVIVLQRVLKGQDAIEIHTV